MSKRALRMVLEWLDLHYTELIDNWELARQRKALNEIQPLQQVDFPVFLHVVSINYLGAYKLRLTFNNQIVREVDLAPELYGEIFEPLKDVNFFRQVFLNPGTNTIEWPNGADFAPEFLYDLGQNIPQTA